MSDKKFIEMFNEAKQLVKLQNEKMARFEGKSFSFVSYSSHLRTLTINVENNLFSFGDTVMINTWTTSIIAGWEAKLIGDPTGWEVEVFNDNQKIILCGEVYMKEGT